VVNTIEAAKAVGGVGRVVLVSSCLTTPKNRLHPLRILLNNVRWGLMDAKFKGEASSSPLFPAAPGRSSRVADPAPSPARAGEEALRASGLPYTVVRPGGLTDKPAGEAQLLACEPRCTHNPLLHPPMHPRRRRSQVGCRTRAQCKATAPAAW
jgi:hypothetical protein